MTPTRWRRPRRSRRRAAARQHLRGTGTAQP